MKKQTKYLQMLVASILDFATNQTQDTEKENAMYKIDYYCRKYAAENGIDYETLGSIEKDFQGLTEQENALSLAHIFTNPTAQNVSDITINLQVTKAFLKTL